MKQIKHGKQYGLAASLVVLGPLLMGCASNTLPASVAGGECRLFRAPDYAILGRTQADQDYIDDFEEAGIAGCKWSRPKARPTVVAAKVVSTVPAAPPVKKHWYDRLKIKHKK